MKQNEMLHEIYDLFVDNNCTIVAACPATSVLQPGVGAFQSQDAVARPAL